jgi:phosphate:Na+ symporter
VPPDPQPLNALEIAVGLIGGLALFLYGMKQVSEGLKSAAGRGMKRRLAPLTTNRFSAAATGAVLTAIIQSSSVTTVLVVGFVSAGLMTVQQSVGVIMGANVGATITAQVVAFQVTKWAWLMVAAGFALGVASHRDLFRHYGSMLLGLGLLFLGMEQMSEATAPLREYGPFVDVMRGTEHALPGILAGAVFTALIQSSSATTGIVIVLASQGFLTLEGGIALAIGANLGTCVTAVISSIGKPPDATRAAMVHVLFNLLGAAIWFGFIPQLADFARAVTPGTDLPREIANANTVFNVANAVLLIGFATPIARLAARLVPDRKEATVGPVGPLYLDPVYLKTPALAVEHLRMELVHMGEHVGRMLAAAGRAMGRHDPAAFARIEGMDDDVDALHRAILDYMHALGRLQLPTDETRLLERYLAIANYLENMGDLISTNLVSQGRKGIPAASRETEALEARLWSAVEESHRDAMRALAEGETDLARTVSLRRSGIHDLADESLRSLSALAREDRIDVDGLRIGMEVVGQTKRLYHNVRRIAEIASDL